MSDLTQESSAVAAAVESLRQAILASDRETLSRIATEGLTYGHSNGRIDDKATFVSKLSGETPAFTTIDITDQSVVVEGGTAIVRHTFTAVTGSGSDVKLHNVLVWTLLDGEWKLAARQAVKI
ncbi:MAG: nuclear transport factor 2 family protein [Luteolibacter sp.]